MARGRKSTVVQSKVRFPYELHKAIKYFAKLRGVSMNEEINDRIQDSYRDDQTLGDPWARCFLSLIGAAIVSAQHSTQKNWLSDSETYNRALPAIYAVLERLGADKGEAREFARKYPTQAARDIAGTLLHLGGWSSAQINAAFEVLGSPTGEH